MPDGFHEWYLTVALFPDAQLIEKRGTAIQRIAEAHQDDDLTIDDALDLVRLYMGAEPAKVSYANGFREVFRVEDSTFPLKGNDHELRVLAGSALVALLQTDSPSSITDAIALAMASTFGLRRDVFVLVPDLVGCAQEHLREEGRRVRRLAQVPPPDDLLGRLQSGLDDLSAVEQRLGTVTEVGQLAEPSTRLKEVVANLNASASSMRSGANMWATNAAIRKEECAILWWLLGKRSIDLDVGFAELQPVLAAVVAGKELADRTELIPGPEYCRAVLHSVLSCGWDSNTAFSITAATCAASETWKREWLGDKDLVCLADFCPVLVSIAHSQTESAPILEQSAFVESYLRSASDPRSPYDLSYQVYLECLLARVLREERSDG